MKQVTQVTDMTLSVAVNEAAKFGNTIRAFAKIAEVAEFLYGQEQVQKEREKKLAQLQADIDAAGKLLDEARDEAQAILESAKAAAHDARDKANAAVLAARADAAAAKAEADKARALAEDAVEDQRAAESALAKALADEEAVRQRIEGAKAEALARIGG